VFKAIFSKTGGKRVAMPVFTTLKNTKNACFTPKNRQKTLFYAT
jgi:hypothetical protein